MAFRCLANLLHVPPGGWKFVQAQSNLIIYGGDYYDLREKVRKHRQFNRYISGPELDAEIQDQICVTMGDEARAHFCRDCASPPGGPARLLDLEDVKHFLQTASGWLSAPSFVSQHEANRRAEICASCPQNVPIRGCASCRNLIKWMFALVGHRFTPLDARLAGCAVCGCSNQAQVHLTLEVLKKGMTEEMKFPGWCWKIGGGQTPEDWSMKTSRKDDA